MYSDVGTKLKKPAVECYVDQHQVTYSTVDVKATQRKAATLPATSSSSDKGTCMIKINAPYIPKSETTSVVIVLELATVSHTPVLFLFLKFLK